MTPARRSASATIPWIPLREVALEDRAEHRPLDQARHAREVVVELGVEGVVADPEGRGVADPVALGALLDLLALDHPHDAALGVVQPLATRTLKVAWSASPTTSRNPSSGKNAMRSDRLRTIGQRASRGARDGTEVLMVAMQRER